MAGLPPKTPREKEEADRHSSIPVKLKKRTRAPPNGTPTEPKGTRNGGKKKEKGEKGILVRL